MSDKSLASMLADALNGVNNAAASTVSAPVDAISWGLRKAGLGNVIGQAPVGGSNWMQQKGLTRPTNGLAGDVGEFAGNVLPIAAAAKAPQIAKGLLKMGENALAPSTLGSQRGAIVYHGSPHTFDAFDMSKIGTGEGAQAYGHGLYLADSPEVAKSYTKVGDPRKVGEFTRNGAPLALDSQAAILARNAIADTRGDAAAAHAWLDELRGMKYSNSKPEDISAAQELVKHLDFRKPENLYKVDLPDEAIAKMLDWDKPLSQQAHVAAVAQRAGVSSDTNGQGLYRALEDMYAPGADYPGAPAWLKADKANAAQKLKEAGIPGIRYLDAGSRGAGDGTRNYVVFDDKLPKILERNGQSLADQLRDKLK